MGRSNWVRSDCYADRVPRPCPATAVPLAEVRLVAMPTWNYADHPGGDLITLNDYPGAHIWSREALGLRVGDSCSRALLAAEWPWLRIRPPEAHT